MIHSGGCLCGHVRYEIHGPLATIEACHCGQCRKAQGTPFATNIPVALTALHFTQGRATLVEYESSPGKFRAFCPRCGSPIYSRRTAILDRVRIRAGSLDDPAATAVVAHIHVGSKANWWPIDDRLPQYRDDLDSPQLDPA